MNWSEARETRCALMRGRWREGPKAICRTREEYLVSFEEKALRAVSLVYTSMDRNLILSYGLSIALVVFNWDNATGFVFLGAKVSVSPDQIYHFIPLLISLIYIPISYQMYRTIGIYKAIKNNSEEIIKLNVDSRPIAIADMRHFESGVAGLILALARWQATTLLTRNPFNIGNFKLSDNFFLFPIKFVLWLFLLISWSILVITRLAMILALFFIPLLICGFFIFKRFLFVWPIIDPIALLVFLSILIVAFVTLWFGMILFVVYFLELLNEVSGELKQRARDLRESMLKFALKIITKNVLFPFS